jgi:cytochrome c oxidase assembly protein subunit 20
VHLLSLPKSMKLTLFSSSFAGLRAIWPACNWAVGTFAIASLVSFELCKRQRVNEMQGMAEAVKLMHDLKVKKEKETEQLKAAREAEQDAERKRKSWTNPSNYKFW